MPRPQPRPLARFLVLLAGLLLISRGALAAQPRGFASDGPELLATAQAIDATPLQIAALDPPAPAPSARTERLASRRILPTVVDLDFHHGRWAFHGYFQLDAALYNQSAAGPPEQDFRRGGVGGEDDHARQLSDGVMPRRARFGGEGSMGDFAYRAMLELASHGGSQGHKGQPHLAEVWISYTRFAPWVIMAGAFPQPSNMEDATSSDSLLFLERATAADLARSVAAGEGRIGVTLKRTDDKWFTALSFTGPKLDREEDFPTSAALVARVSHTLAATPDRSVHLGASATYVLSSSDNKRPSDVPTGIPLRFKNTPEVDVDSTHLIDTGDIQASHAKVVGVEFAAQRRDLFLQSEAFRIAVDRGVGTRQAAAHFDGFYVEGSWILTGERRRWDPSRAAFWFPKPARPLGQGWGAWELAFRYSRMNLNYQPGEAGLPPPPGGVRGGDQKIFALGLNWYPRTHWRLMFDYMRVSVNRLNPASLLNPQPFGPPPATPPVGVQIGQTMDVLAMRARYSF